MAHQISITGIRGEFGDPAPVRLYRIVIEDELLVLSHTIPVETQVLADDYDRALTAAGGAAQLASEPAYYLIRLTPAAPEGTDEWLFAPYVPETLHPTRKMHYAFAQNTLKKAQLAAFKIADSLHASRWDELTFAGYDAHRRAQNVDAMSAEEKERVALETTANDFANARPMGLPGMMVGTARGGIFGAPSNGGGSNGGLAAFPVADEVRSAVESKVEVGGHVIATVVNETISLHTLVPAAEVNVQSKVPTDVPSFIVTRVATATLVMTFCCPELAKVKERMIASSARASLLAYLDSLASGETAFKLAKRFEVSEIADIESLAEMRAECGLTAEGEERPKVEEVKPAVSAATRGRPRPPGRPRGTA